MSPQRHHPRRARRARSASPFRRAALLALPILLATACRNVRTGPAGAIAGTFVGQVAGTTAGTSMALQAAGPDAAGEGEVTAHLCRLPRAASANAGAAAA